MVLALCLWGVCAFDYATPGIFDRGGNIKFQDFLQFPVSARLIANGRADELYNPQVLTDAIRGIAGRESRVRLQYFYGPQVAIPFLPMVRLPFIFQAAVWVVLSLLMYFCCIYLVWKNCDKLKPCAGVVALCAISYPPLFHFFVRGQLSALMLVCFTAAYLSFVARLDWLAGIALGCLVLKPQFLLAIPLVMLLAQSWRALAGLVLSALAQMAVTFGYFGRPVISSYFRMLLHSAGQPGTTELSLSPIQMHSLRSFWALLIPSSQFVWVLYIFSSTAVIAITVAIWKSSSPLTVRFSALILAAVLVNPHLYIYDLLALAPAFLLIADWALSNPQHPSTPALHVTLYLAFVLPLLGPISRWTHLQLSVPVFVCLLCLLWRISSRVPASSAPALATSESPVV